MMKVGDIVKMGVFLNNQVKDEISRLGIVTHDRGMAGYPNDSRRRFTVLFGFWRHTGYEDHFEVIDEGR